MSICFLKIKFIKFFINILTIYEIYIIINLQKIICKLNGEVYSNGKFNLKPEKIYKFFLILISIFFHRTDEKLAVGSIFVIIKTMIEILFINKKCFN